VTRIDATELFFCAVVRAYWCLIVYIRLWPVRDRQQTPHGKADTAIEHRCSTTIGVVLFIGNEATRDNVLDWADAAMYQAKDGGRNSIRFYDSKA
jgi:GGDEF domain-containing protein